ncbi:hypothetical protein [Mesorhizobium cantuariense]|uniref:Uncharacterized protein n=1 Tax=Mesorhizobium cantuariense TaxID=1300275 RepID=A0ABV7MMP9_9HYPH
MAENERGGDVLDEPQDEDTDRESSLGWATGTDQRFTIKAHDTAWVEDGEQDASFRAFFGHGTGYVTARKRLLSI